ncbi:MAG: helix-turn-helix domain-containing protein [Clostridiales Family XIII bacterium]|jgi:predicted DNA-binding protein YlxM (UPF0122 family)|nr:helix-turn-helix domain-containing protein [Clostridiales Family XIII bacterium]
MSSISLERYGIESGVMKAAKNAAKNIDVRDFARMSLLFDYYGKLLSERQQAVFGFYHEDNYTLEEIARELGISKQGVHDALRRAQAALNGYEERLGLIAKHDAYLKALKTIEETAAKIKTDETGIQDHLGTIQKTIGELDI